MALPLVLLSLFFTCINCALVKEKSNVQLRRAIPPLPVSSSLTRSARQNAPCQRNDITCWCLKSVDYTNDVRVGRGLSILRVGTENQLRNANNFAQKLAGQRWIEHQNFDAANREIGCGRALGGENVALNYQTGDIARACVDQWIISPGHMNNILTWWFLEVVVGFALDSDGGVYCVQTFAVTDNRNGQTTDPGCQPVSGSSGSGGPPWRDLWVTSWRR